MKRICLILAALTLLLSACGRNGSGGGRVKITAVAFPHYDIARAVAGEYADIVMLLPPGTEAHSYEPSPRDIIAVQNSDLFIYTGGESDEWIDSVLSSMDERRGRDIRMMDCVALRREEILPHMTAAEAGDEEYDEHVWTSPPNAAAIAEEICSALCDIDPAHAGDYRARTEAFTDELDMLDESFRLLADGAARHTLIFGDRFPFLYFVREYGFDYLAAFPGCSGDVDANPATVARLIDEVRRSGAPVVFKCDLSAGKLAETIAAETGAKVLTLYSCHTVSRDDFDAGETYISLMKKNLEALGEALN
ncbi:MAG: metal ABC transporter substrate-binding protein [Oscillospiraceae bacterium]|nr:metal ABC transporter substrate-binding protein [Oscillospiraceae bacterium]